MKTFTARRKLRTSYKSTFRNGGRGSKLVPNLDYTPKTWGTKKKRKDAEAFIKFKLRPKYPHLKFWVEKNYNGEYEIKYRPKLK
jgi:hypothetical protein